MTLSRFRFAALAALALTGCSYLQGSSGKDEGTAAPPKPSVKPASARLTSGGAVVKSMHDLYGGKYLKTMSVLQNNTAYTTSGQEQYSQWYEHMEIPGRLRIAFLPATQRSGLVQVDDNVATFDNGIRADFRPSINPLLLLTADVYAAPLATIMRGLDSVGVDPAVLHLDTWEGHPVYVVGAKAGDSTANQMWVDADRMILLRFIQRGKSAERPVISDFRVLSYKEIQGYQVPTEFLVIRNGRPAWREEYANIRVNEELPAGTFDQALWKDIPIPQ